MVWDCAHICVKLNIDIVYNMEDFVQFILVFNQNIQFIFFEVISFATNLF